MMETEGGREKKEKEGRQQFVEKARYPPGGLRLSNILSYSNEKPSFSINHKLNSKSMSTDSLRVWWGTVLFSI